MQYVLGIDSGGTKYLVRAVATNGAFLGEYKGSTCSHYSLAPDEAEKRIDNYLSACLTTFGGKREDCVRIVCGTTGYDSPEDGELLHGLYAQLPGFSCSIDCMNDVELAHYTVTGGEGLLVLSGTGSIVFGRNRQGEERRVAGWPQGIMGEEGSGRYIDARALQHYSRYLDGCRPRTPLIEAIDQVIGPFTRKALMDYATTLMTPPWPSPNLGKSINQAATQGDKYAGEILQDAGRWLFRLAKEAICLLRLQQEKRFPVGFWGGVLLHSSIIREELSRLLHQHYPQAYMVYPNRDAAQGAVEMALHRFREEK